MQKAGQKLNVATRITPFMNATKIECQQIIMNLFVQSHFWYCPLIWNLNSRGLKKIFYLHSK